MKKKDMIIEIEKLQSKIEALERRIKDLEDRHQTFSPFPVYPYQPPQHIPDPIFPPPHITCKSDCANSAGTTPDGSLLYNEARPFPY